ATKAALANAPETSAAKSSAPVAQRAAAASPAPAQAIAPKPPVKVIAPLASSSAASGAGEIDGERWLKLIAQCGLKGPAGQLAAHASFVGFADGVLRLALPPTDEHLRAPNLVKQLADSLSSCLGGAPQIKFETVQATGDTLHQRSTRARDARQASAEDTFMSDPDVQRLITQHGAKVVPDSIRPFDE
ncbi:MAG: DNA polymerase III subunit gamma/tau, partial [Pseudomonadota bacterium]|nr:DNA polymerase III subunit gamma/tau [Pseudomonadota bacterium]